MNTMYACIFVYQSVNTDRRTINRLRECVIFSLYGCGDPINDQFDASVTNLAAVAKAKCNDEEGLYFI